MCPAVLDAPTLESLIAAAVAAPSVHNTQPWRFRLDPDTGTVVIRAGPERTLRLLDPGCRAIHVSVGCAVFNLRVAAAHFGWEPVTRLLPCPDRPDVLATVRLAGCARPSSPAGLYEAVWRRHSSRFPFSGRPLPATVLNDLAEAALAEGGRMRLSTPPETDRILRITWEAEHRNASDADRAAESRHRVQGPPRAAPGVPPAALGPPDFPDPLPMRDFGAHRHPAVLAARPHERRPTIALLSTAHDRRTDWLRAGQALECVLLVAAAHGVRSSLLHQALEWPDLRRRLASPDADQHGHVQMVVRLGYGPEAPWPPRRTARDVLAEDE
ncbi:nitroreductase family protein [Streptomyces sp. NPDC046197]|uniref:Acg family FMN-binding oxidoreductase n=1 Tax=Streptomyces sp. NPDC046197 TaxID=3154337 RepID=UPI0034032447